MTGPLGIEWEYMKTKPSDLLPNERNPRKISDERLAVLKERIKEQGFRVPPTVDRDMTILCGHQRVRALIELGHGDIDILVARPVSDLTDDMRRQIVASDNISWGEHDFDILMTDYTVEELLDYGFLDTEIPHIDVVDHEEPAMDEDDLPEDGAGSFTTNQGDVWDIGDHRLVCGDSTSTDTYDALLHDGLAHMMWTDPPYNVNYEGRAGKIQNDHMGDGDFYQFLYDFYSASIAFIRDGGAAYVAHADTEGLNFRAAFRDAGFYLSGCLIWVKPSLVLGRSDYQWQHEPILYGWKGTGTHKWYGGRKQTTAFDDSGIETIEEGKSYNMELKDGFVNVKGDNVQVEVVDGTVIRVDKPKRSDEHPTMKPVSLIERMLHNSSRSGQIVLDAFGGSGSTMVACQKTKRKARLVELDPKFCDVIVNRMHKLYPDLPISRNGQPYKVPKDLK